MIRRIKENNNASENKLNKNNNVKDNHHVIYNRSYTNSTMATWLPNFLYNGWLYSHSLCNSNCYGFTKNNSRSPNCLSNKDVQNEVDTN